MRNKQLICYVGNGCTNMFQGQCMCRGIKPFEAKIQKCEDYHPRGKYNQ